MSYSQNSCLDAVDTIGDRPTTVCLCPLPSGSHAYYFRFPALLQGPLGNASKKEKHQGNPIWITVYENENLYSPYNGSIKQKKKA